MEKNELDSFNISKSGSLIEDIKKVEIKLNEVPDIEVKEVVIKETGNFLNLKDNIINIPVEMIVFPFFTPQKQNKRVNFQYSFEDLGVTMSCTLIAKDNQDKVFQPSIFEEKIYTYLISLYEIKKEINNTDEYIEFEISDFIVNFLGNKMNRTYYTKVEQALKNLKNTEYQFVVSNHTKLGNYKFEDEEFKLLTYQKLEKGRKKYYRVTLNKNIRQKIKDKRYIKYNSRSLLEILTKDPIAGRIYKYISKIRYDKEGDTINLRTLAAIIPLKTEQVTERVNKNGEIKQYILCRLKQVLKRVEKAFDILVELEYITKYKSSYKKDEDTYYIEYIFNRDKDGDCHISTFLENKINESRKIERKERKIIIDKNDIIEAQIVAEPDVSASKVTVDNFEFSDEIIEKIKKAKRNIYVQKSWDKRTDTKIRKILREEGEDRVVEVLNILYKNLQGNIRTTLVQYINGILKNLSKGDKEGTKDNLTLFGNNVKGLKNKRQINQARKSGRKSIYSASVENNGNLDRSLNISENMEASSYHIEEGKETLEIKLTEVKKFEEYDEYEKLKIEEKALKLCAKEMNVGEAYLLSMKEKSIQLYEGVLKVYIEKIIEDEKY